jgi:hypothetical protein
MLLPNIVVQSLYYAIIHIQAVDYGKLNPKPAMQFLYLSIVVAQSFWGSLELLKSMHSSREAFSSLHTQHGWESLDYHTSQVITILP